MRPGRGEASHAWAVSEGSDQPRGLKSAVPERARSGEGLCPWSRGGQELAVSSVGARWGSPSLDGPRVLESNACVVLKIQTTAPIFPNCGKMAFLLGSYVPGSHCAVTAVGWGRFRHPLWGAAFLGTPAAAPGRDRTGKRLDPAAGEPAGVEQPFHRRTHRALLPDSSGLGEATKVGKRTLGSCPVSQQ